ncbi:hypothetical protein KUCAC02_022251 [Chaenocephalus aceratus]|nr:hypothetical protein KUCAC02_022251 [Chaenocephalus aceratus]
MIILSSPWQQPWLSRPSLPSRSDPAQDCEKNMNNKTDESQILYPQCPIYTSRDFEPENLPPLPAISVSWRPSLESSSEVGQTCRTEPLSDNLGRMTKLLVPGKQKQEEGEVERGEICKKT